MSVPPTVGLALMQDVWLTRGVMWRRVVGWWLDMMLLFMLGWSLWTTLLMLGLFTLGVTLPLISALPLVPLAYHVLFVASPLAATPGQALLGLRVVRNDDLSRPTIIEAAVMVLLFFLTLAMGVIWLGVALFTTRHRTLHDMLSGLLVVRRRALAVPWIPAWDVGGAR